MYEIKRFGCILGKLEYIVDLWNEDKKLNLEIHIPMKYKCINRQYEKIFENLITERLKIELKDLGNILGLIIQERGN